MQDNQYDIDQQLEQCRKIARNAHAGQMRHDGITQYIDHVEKVAKIVGKDKYLQCVAWLHDVIEDCNVVPEALVALGVDPGIVDRVLVLTHKTDDTYMEYIRKIRYSQLSGCIKVKIADMVANLSDDPSSFQIERYNKSLLIFSRIND